MAFTSATTHALTSGDLMWDSAGYVSLDGQSWTDVTITATFIYNSGKIGLLPRFQNNQGYVSFTIGNFLANDVSIVAPVDAKAVAILEAEIVGQTYQLGKVELPSLTIGGTYIIKAVIKKTNYKIYLNNALIFNAEYSPLVMGTSALYATAGNSCSIVEALDPIADQWQSNLAQVSGATVQLRSLPNNDVYIHMVNPDALTLLTVKQIVNITAGTVPYTLSYQYMGEMRASIIELNGTNINLSHDLDNSPVSVWTTGTLTTPIAANCTQIAVQFTVSKATPVDIDHIQLEANPFVTSYIENISLIGPAVRSTSKITYPSTKNINADGGAISLWMKPDISYTSALGQKPVLFEYGGPTNYTRIYYDGVLQFRNGIDIIQSANTTLVPDTWYHIVVCWTQASMSIAVNNKQVQLAGTYTAPDSSTLIRIGHSIDPNLHTFNGTIDEMIIFSKPITLSDINGLYQATDAMKKTDQMLIHSTFDYEIANFEASMMEISPAPLYGSPVIAVKDDSTVMNKVSYFDPYTGEYHPYNIEPVVYNGKADYIEVGSKNIETVKFKTIVKDRRGVQIGDPYTINGGRISLTLTASQKTKYRGQTLYVTYQPKDTYVVDFNIDVPDSFRVSLGKHDGQGVSVTYEGSRIFVDKLSTMTELNPLLSPQHEGFMYLTQTGRPISSFRAKATPTDLLADGSSESIVIIEPLDSLGNFVANANLIVSASRGSVIPNSDYGSVQLRLTAGRYIYKYRAPLIRYQDIFLPELPESINVIDKDTGLGVQIPMTLTLSDRYPNQGNVTQGQQNWERIASYILDKIMANFGQKTTSLPTGLGVLLDLSGSGIIDMSDIIWLNDKKLTDALYQKYIALVQWYTANGG